MFLGERGKAVGKLGKGRTKKGCREGKVGTVALENGESSRKKGGGKFMNRVVDAFLSLVIQ